MAASLFSFGIPSIICSVVEPGITVWLWSLLQERIFFFFFPSLSLWQCHGLGCYLTLAPCRLEELPHAPTLEARGGGQEDQLHA